MDNLGEFTPINGFQTLITAFQFLECLDRGLRHASVGFFGAADEHEVFTLGHSFVAVLIIQADTYQTSGVIR